MGFDIPDAVGVVSIPQSGFGAFEPQERLADVQGLHRVSIPQSGFGAFELVRSGGGTPPPPSFNPSVGIRGV